MQPKKLIPIGSLTIGKKSPPVIIAGPCAIEGETECFSAAKRLKEIFQEQGLPFIFKSSYDKANRSSHESQRGVGIDRGLRILEKVRREIGVPVLTDVHDDTPIDAVAESIGYPTDVAAYIDASDTNDEPIPEPDPETQEEDQQY